MSCSRSPERCHWHNWLAALVWVLACALPPSRTQAADVVSHLPVQPRSGETVRVRIEASRLPAGSSAAVEYQIVEPGRYFDADSSAYRRGWQALPLKPAAEDAKVLEAEIPGSVQKHRRLIRYRVVDAANSKRLLPRNDDACPNYAYYTYDGIPAWRAAINPGGSGSIARVTEFGTNVMRSVPAIHLISTRAAIEGSQWKEPTQFGSEEAHEYRWKGTLVGTDGTVYDHIRYRPRGGCWRYAMGKNMWKIDFNKGHKFRAYDDWGRPYAARWGKLNLGACIQQGDYGMRGEQGLFEAVGFRLFNLADLPAPTTHYLQLRVVTEADEAGSNQFAGDFWGLYLAVENVDENFIKQHDLPDQSVFKVDGMRPQWGEQGGDGLTEADGGRFMQQLFRQPSEAWFRKNLHLPEYYSYRTILEAIHHYDVDAGKNYFFRRDPGTKRWSVVPWDIDLTWGNHMFGGGHEPFYAAGALRQPALLKEYRNRLLELRDLLFNPTETGALIDEYLAVIATPIDNTTFAEADRRKWDYHPIASSRYVVGGMKTEPGMFYAASPTRDVTGMARLMKDYVASRSRYLDSRLLAGQPVPSTPQIVAEEKSAGATAARSFRLREAAPAGSVVEWHVGESTPVQREAGRVRRPRAYEVTTVWATNQTAVAQIPASVFQPGRTYRVRARVVDAEGHAGHYSTPVDVAGAP